jgi:hypothetical protein
VIIKSYTRNGYKFVFSVSKTPFCGHFWEKDGVFMDISLAETASVHNFIITNSAPDQTDLVAQCTTLFFAFFRRQLSLRLGLFLEKMWGKFSISNPLFGFNFCFLFHFSEVLQLQSLLLTHPKILITPVHDFIISVHLP